MKLTRNALTLAVAVCITFSTPSFATNGEFLIGYGAKSRSMGGVAIAYAQDGFASAVNPAAITSIGTRVDLDMMLFYPKRQVTMPDPRPIPNAGNPIKYKSGSNLFLIPAMAGVYKFNRKMTLGFSFVGAAGGNTRYTRLSPLGSNFLNPAQREDVGDTLGVNLLQAQMSMTAAYKLTKNHSIGFSPVFGVASFRAYGLGVFKTRSADPDNLTGRGNDYAYGAGVRLGWRGKLHKRLTVGAAYQSRIYFTKFDKYRGLFAEQGSLDSPEIYGAGLALQATEKLDIAFDIQRTLYSDVAAIGNPIENINTPEGFLGENDGAGFGWRDQTVYKLGMKYKLNPRWDVQLGGNYGRAPMPSDQLLFSTVAPAVTEWHLTMGTTYKPGEHIEWSVAYVHAFRNKEKGVANSGGTFDNFFPNKTQTGPGDMELEMVQDSIEVSFSYKI